jgi:hypothetical protein
MKNQLDSLKFLQSKADLGEWTHTSGKWYADEADKGIQTSEDARFYGKLPVGIKSISILQLSC